MVFASNKALSPEPALGTTSPALHASYALLEVARLVSELPESLRMLACSSRFIGRTASLRRACGCSDASSAGQRRRAAGRLRRPSPCCGLLLHLDAMLRARLFPF